MKTQLPAELQSKLAEYQLEGLIQEGFEPLGDSDHARRKSIEARAYTTWIREHGHLSHLGPEDLRTTFVHRHDPNWAPPGPERKSWPPALLGFSTAERALPRGDAWEGANSLFLEPAEDAPPPPEVS